MSLLDNISQEKSHDDVRQNILNNIEYLEENFEHNFVLRVRCKIEFNDKSSVKKGNEVCRYFEDVFEHSLYFRLIRTRSTTMINHITAATYVFALVIGFNRRPTRNTTMKFLMLISTAIIHFRPLNGFTFTITDLNKDYEKHRISGNKLFNFDVWQYISKQFDIIDNVHRRTPMTILRPHKTISNYYEKNNIDDSDIHFIPELQ